MSGEQYSDVLGLGNLLLELKSKACDVNQRDIKRQRIGIDGTLSSLAE
jgi:hypothetical protein